MRDNASRRGAVSLGVPLMLLAFITIGGFFYWLYLQSAQQRQIAVEAAREAAAAEAEAELLGTVVDVSDLEIDATPFQGKQITVEGVAVASLLGTQGMWLNTPGGNPFLVSFSEAVKAEGVSVRGGDTVTISGSVRAMSPEVAGEWVESGAISEGDRLAAEFATHFLQADRIQPASAAGSPDTTGAGGGTPGGP